MLAGCFWAVIGHFQRLTRQTLDEEIDERPQAQRHMATLRVQQSKRPRAPAI